jgi:DNA modification methylase/superfamily II DNA or RNA helicase
MNYLEFIEGKGISARALGIEIADSDIHPILFEWQRLIVRWAARKGRAAIFADTGLGKTFMQLEWARLIHERTLIVAPLSVARQTVREGGKIGVDVSYCRSQSDVSDGISITNYEMIEHFDAEAFGAVVLDESSILKSLDGKTRKKLIEMFGKTPYRLCCTATPAPNDQSEIGNHAEFLGIMTMSEMLAAFFVHDEMEWRLKGHARQSFYKWMASWGMSVRKPSDIGFDDDGYNLPPLRISPAFTKTEYVPDGQLFFMGLKGIEGRSEARKATVGDRVEVAARIANDAMGQVIVWCGLNTESSKVHSLIADSVELVGSDEPEYKAKIIEEFQDGRHRVLVTKPKIAGMGMNFQNAHQMIFLGLSDSFEAYYQCIRRCYRFGQKKSVTAHIVLSDIEKQIFENVLEKERVAKSMSEELIKNVQIYEQEEMGTKKNERTHYETKTESGDGWKAMLGDSCERLAEVQDSSVDLSVYSPPFADLYTYSPSERDLGNSKNWGEFFGHYSFIIKELLRVTKQGRLTCVHTADVPAMLAKNGYIGLRDFPGAVIRAYEENGWTYYGRVTIEKNPQAQAIRTHAKALLFVQMEKDSSWSRPAIGDYVLIFKKPGENLVPVRPVHNKEVTREDWIKWASPIWTGVSESDTLQYTTARDGNDERHICPLQIEVIERCIKLWSNPGEVVLTPFGGIGSEGHTAIRLNRRTILIELKESYFNVAVQNLKDAVSNKKQTNLFADHSGAK